MKKEAQLLKSKGTSSLLLAIDHFNRVSDLARTEAVLLMLEHSLEMILKASLLWRGARIRDPGEQNTISFKACIRRCLTDDRVRFLKGEQALVLQTISGLRDAAQHHLLTLSEGQLYFHTQSGVTLFADILKSVFDENLTDILPDRALPISTIAPLDPLALFASEMEQVKIMLAPGRRKRVEADARLRGLIILDSSLQGESVQPGVTQLRNMGQKITEGKAFDELFPGIAAVNFVTEGQGAKVNLRITKKEGIPIQLVKEGTPEAIVVAVKSVEELGFYSLGLKQLADKLGITAPKTTAVVHILRLKDDPDSHKQIVIGKSKFDRYSQNAIKKIKDLLKERSIEEIWNEYREQTSKVGASLKE